MWTITIIKRLVIIWLLILLGIRGGTSKRALRQLEQKDRDGPVYTYVKTDQQANIKWGVRHYVPRRVPVITNGHRRPMNVSINPNASE